MSNWDSNMDQNFLAFWEAIKPTIELIADKIVTLEYEHRRDLSFIKRIVTQILSLRDEDLEETYRNYCKEFDILNKYLLTDRLFIKPNEVEETNDN